MKCQHTDCFTCPYPDCILSLRDAVFEQDELEQRRLRRREYHRRYYHERRKGKRNVGENGKEKSIYSGL